MANICLNKVTIRHDNADKMKIAIDAWNRNCFLATLIPEPDYSGIVDPRNIPSILNEPCESLEEVQKTHRAIAWNSSEEIDNCGKLWDGEVGVLRCEFRSRHAAPIAAYDAIIALGYSVEAFYYGDTFIGSYGSQSKNCDIIISSWSRRWIRKNIPQRLIQEFDLISRATQGEISR